MSEFNPPQETIGEPMPTIKDATRAIRRALDAQTRATSYFDEQTARAALEVAVRRLEMLTSDDRPAPVDMGEMCKQILLDPYRRGA